MINNRGKPLKDETFFQPRSEGLNDVYRAAKVFYMVVYLADPVNDALWQIERFIWDSVVIEPDFKSGLAILVEWGLLTK